MSLGTRVIGEAEIHIGDCLESLRQLPKASIQTCVTSPPYFGLRDYGMDGQFGLEETPDQYIAKMVEVFREVRRVLADDGTLWVNIGDSYSGAGPSGASYQSESTKRRTEMSTDGAFRISKTLAARGLTYADKKPVAVAGMKKKDLIGIPWMLAFALRADGWYLRQDIIWHKPNPMPESVRDRCTKAHEYIFLLSKSARYYFDSEAMREDVVKGAAGSSFNKGKTAEHQLGRSSDAERVEDGKRNRRSVWTVATRPYKGAHFATFPTALIEPCILAGSRPGDIVLDPFLGSGTTAAVALQHGRKAVGLELNPAYADLAVERIEAARRMHMGAANDPKPAPMEAANDSFAPVGQSDLFGQL
jgi:DNA modification methylase